MIKTFEQFENHIDCEILQDYFWDIMDAGIKCKFTNMKFGGFENVPIILLDTKEARVAYSKDNPSSGFQSMMLENPRRSFKVEIANVLDRIKAAHDISFERISMGDILFLIEYDTYKKVYNNIDIKQKQQIIDSPRSQVKSTWNCMNDYIYQSLDSILLFM